MVSDRLGRVRRAERLHVAELVDWDGGRVESEVDLARDGGETGERQNGRRVNLLKIKPHLNLINIKEALGHARVC